MFQKILISCVALALLQHAHAEDTTPEKPIVIKARHTTGRGPCIFEGDTIAMPIIEVFEIQEVVSGSLPKTLKQIKVRALTDKVVGYTKGDVYLIQFTPTADSKSQLAEREKDSYEWIWVNGEELKIQKKLQPPDDSSVKK